MERLDDDDDGALFRMHFYNLDGGRCRMCFNGARCCALRAVGLDWGHGEFSFWTDYGLINARVDGGEVRLGFAPPTAEGETVDLPKGSIASKGHPVMTGDPHLVVEVDGESFDAMDFEAAARPLRWWREVLPEGANVHMVHRGEDEWRIRSFERGVEGETWACGSGCIATAFALGNGAGVRLRTRGGHLIEVEPGQRRWSLNGPAELVFEGSFDVEEQRV